MFYLAKHHVNVAGLVVRPGDVFEAEFTREQETWLLKTGAMARTGTPVPVDSTEVPIHPEPEEAPESEVPAGNPPEEPQEAGEDEDAEAPAPMIDVMDGIVEAPAEPATPVRSGKGRGRKK